jgi:hypothetical protein
MFVDLLSVISTEAKRKPNSVSYNGSEDECNRRQCFSRYDTDNLRRLKAFLRYYYCLFDWPRGPTRVLSDRSNNGHCTSRYVLLVSFGKGERDSSGMAERKFNNRTTTHWPSRKQWRTQGGRDAAGLQPPPPPYPPKLNLKTKRFCTHDGI